MTITIDGPADKRMELFGPADCNLRAIREALGVKIFARDAVLKVVGESEAVGKAAIIIDAMQKRLGDRSLLTSEDLAEIMADAAVGTSGLDAPSITVFNRASPVRPKTPGQEAYARAIQECDLCVCLGPAGTGKTYIAVAVALSLLKAGKLKRIVLARPAVEAGEKLGYLPGDMQAKVNPYLRPLFDAMHDMMDFEQIKRFMANDIIEVIPLAFMRGRTLNNAAIILDEAQNATPQQMLMFLTRLGEHSKMIITGDDSQSDLGDYKKSGLVDAVRRLEGIDGIRIVRLTKEDIVRHRLVTQIVHAYGESNPPQRKD